MISTETHVKAIWLSITAMVLGYFGMQIAQGRTDALQDTQIAQIKHDTDVELAKINERLASIQVSIMEMRNEMRRRENDDR